MQAILLATLILSAPGVTPPQAWSSDTYGHPSGAKARLQAGLVLEVVDGHGPAPVLRLLGGTPGNPASILVSNEPRAEEPGSALLIGAVEQRLDGTFGPRGIFSVPLLDVLLDGDAGWFAQGFEQRSLPFDGTALEASQGLSALHDRPQSMPPLLSKRAFKRRHAEALGGDAAAALQAGDLAEALRQALNSAGDSVRLGLDGNVGGGVEVVTVTHSAGAGLEILRTEDDAYELSVSARRAVQLGVGLHELVEAYGEFELAGQVVFRFHSVPGLLRFVNAWQAAGALGDAGVELLEPRAADRALERARSGMEQAALARDEARDRVELARRALRKLQGQASQGLDLVGKALGGRLGAQFNAARAHLREVLEAKVATAEREVEQAERALQSIFEQTWTTAEVAWQCSRAHEFALDHVAAIEFQQMVHQGLAAGLPIPVELPQLDAGLELRETIGMTLRVDLPGANAGVTTITATQPVVLVAEGSGGLAVWGAQAGIEQALVLSYQFQIEDGVITEGERAIEISLDVESGLRGESKLVLFHGQTWSRGRSMSVRASQDLMLPALYHAWKNGEGLLQGALAVIGSKTIAYGHQDRSASAHVFGGGLSVYVFAGGGQLEFSRVECAPRMHWQISAAEVWEALSSGLEQLAD